MLILNILYFSEVLSSPILCFFEMLSLHIELGPLETVVVGLDPGHLLLELPILPEYLILVGLVLARLLVHLDRALLNVLLQLRPLLLTVVYQSLAALHVPFHILQNVQTR